MNYQNIYTKEDQLLKASKEKDELSKYLFKIEKVVKGNTGGQNGTTVMTFTDKDINDENNNKNFEAFDSQSLTINISGGSPNVCYHGRWKRPKDYNHFKKRFDEIFE